MVSDNGQADAPVGLKAFVAYELVRETGASNITRRPLALVFAQDEQHAYDAHGTKERRAMVESPDAPVEDVLALAALAQLHATIQLVQLVAGLTQVAGAWHADHEARKISQRIRPT